MGKNLLALAFLPALMLGQGAATPASGSVPALSVPEKFEYRVFSSFGPTKLFVVGLEAGYDQLTNTPSEWHQGAEGFGKRYASQFGATIVRQTIAFGVEAATHEDPRYFPSGEKGFMRRTKNALKYAIIARKDSGEDQFAYARMSSALAAGFISTAWQPHSTHTVGNAFSTFGITIAGDAGFNFLQEFIPFLRPKELRNR